ncbi:MAG: tetratricopeptide repeat protein [Burkholderiales bacterium]|nr:tetratricopeptide repeat protein [Burkholderiales bacterium]
MNVPLRATAALLAASLTLPAFGADAPTPVTSAASMPAAARCAAPTADKAANRACALALAKAAEADRAARRDDAALDALARADQFQPEDLRFVTAHAGLKLKLANQLTPAGIEAAAKAAPGDVGLAMMHAELATAKKDHAAALADIDRVIAARPGSAQAWEMRASINVARPDFPAARADVEHALALDPKSPVVLRLRGVLRNNAGDHAGALADYEAAHALAPRPDDPFVIGSTQFLMRQFGDAAASLARRPPPAPDGLYWRIWRYLALARLTGMERASGALGPGTPPGPGLPWPGPVIDFLRGSISEDALLADARRSQDARDLSQVCEAHFYLGEDAVLRQRSDAVEQFRAAARECPVNFHEYEGATAELRAMGQPLRAPGPTIEAARAAASAASAASATR